jgi:aminoglycoside phosphotransferase (APT) family kinase protein
VSAPVGWLADRSPARLRTAVARVAPGLSQLRIVDNGRLVTGDPRFFQGSAVLGDAFVVKYAWSEPAARRIAHEAQVLSALAAAAPALPLPQIVAASSDPAILITRRVPGAPVTVDMATVMDGEIRSRLVKDLGGFLAGLHDPGVLEAVRAAGAEPPPPEPQADTSMLRDALGRFIEARQQPRVAAWCDWVDDVLGSATPNVLLHGDLHGHNLVWDRDSGALSLVADFEQASEGDPAFDFRYLPGQAATLAFFEEVVAAYQQAGGQPVDTRKVMAWHIRTALGDALWRRTAGVALPDGGTPTRWVEELAYRLAALGIRT